MARPVSEYVCNNCGHVTTKWSGKCEACDQWNTISEMAGSAAPPIGRGAKKTKGKSVELAPLAGNDKEPERRKSGIGEFDRVLGGGLVPGYTYRRRPGHRQIDFAFAGGSSSQQIRWKSYLCVGRGSARPASHARIAPRPVRRQC